MTTAPDDVRVGKSSLALALSAALTAGIGLLYWIVMGRLYAPAEVGAAAAVITAATMLSAFGNLGLGAYFERFLPVAGGRRLPMAVGGMVAGTVCGLVLGAVFLVVGPTAAMFTSRSQALWFPVFVAVLSAFALLDHLSIAMDRAGWAAVKNVVHAAAKLGLAVVAALFVAHTGHGSTGMTATWIGAAAVCGLILFVPAIRRLSDDRLIPETAHPLPGGGERFRFAAANYGAYVITALTPLLLPLIVIDRAGAAQNAYFAIVWSLLSSVLVLLTMLMGPYVSAVAADESRFVPATRRFVATLIAVAVLACLGFVVVGPPMLALAGDDYAAAGGPVLRAAAPALLFAALGIAFTAVCRVRRRLAPAIVVQSITALLMLSLTLRWIPDHGLIGASWAMLIAEGVAATLVALPLARVLLGRVSGDGAGAGTGVSRPEAVSLPVSAR